MPKFSWGKRRLNKYLWLIVHFWSNYGVPQPELRTLVWVRDRKINQMRALPSGNSTLGRGRKIDGYFFFFTKGPVHVHSLVNILGVNVHPLL